MAGLALACFLLVALQAALVAGSSSENEMRINFLSDRLDDLQGDLDARREAAQDKMFQLTAIKYKVFRHEQKKRCGKREIMCPGGSKRCISDLWVCDGHTDCPGGEDEDQEFVCNNKAHAGLDLHGDLNPRMCDGSGATHIRVQIIANRRYSWFTAVEDIRAVVTLTKRDGSKSSSTVDGKYFYGGQAILLHNAKAGGVDLICRFPAKLGNICEADFERVPSGDICGHAVLRVRDH